MSELLVLDKPDRGNSAAQLWAFIGIDKDGNEGIMAMLISTGFSPMIFSRFDLVEKFKAEAKRAGRVGNLRVVVRVYSQATDIEEL